MADIVYKDGRLSQTSFKPRKRLPCQTLAACQLDK